MLEHYKISLACTRSDANDINRQLEVNNQWTLADEVPTIVTREIVEFNDDKWMIDIYLSSKPSKTIFADIETLLGRPISPHTPIEKFVDEDWLTLSQAGLESINIGSFYVHNKNEKPKKGKINLCITAGQAFGTGHHHTTSGCLAALDNLHTKGQNFQNIADIGTGTGLLAFAAHKLWPFSNIIASDIDPVAVDFASSAARDNDILAGQGNVTIICASGTEHPAIEKREPYDLLIANILAGPLIELAPAFHQILDKDGLLILAGLLDKQLENIIKAYEKVSMQLVSTQKNNGWPIVIFKKHDAYNHKPSIRLSGRTSQAEGDYGEW